MTVGCANEWLGDGYAQYRESDCVWCPCCNKIFCQTHGKKHQQYLKGKRMRPMSVSP